MLEDTGRHLVTRRDPCYAGSADPLQDAPILRSQGPLPVFDHFVDATISMISDRGGRDQGLGIRDQDQALGKLGYSMTWPR